MEIPMIAYLVVSTIMFFAGVYGFVTRKNMLAMLISLELMLNAVDINFVVFNRYLYPEALEGFFHPLCNRHRRCRDSACHCDHYQYFPSYTEC